MASPMESKRTINKMVQLKINEVFSSNTCAKLNPLTKRMNKFTLV